METNESEREKTVFPCIPMAKLFRDVLKFLKLKLNFENWCNSF